jgi:NAD+ diphosphatase
MSSRLSTVHRAVRRVCAGGGARSTPAYVGAPLSRPLDSSLESPSWLESIHADASHLLIDLESSSAAVDRAGNLAWVSAATAKAVSSDPPVLLGRRKQAPPSFLNDRYAQVARDTWLCATRTDVEKLAAADAANGAVAKRFVFAGLRELVGKASAADACVAGQARSLLHWHSRFRFCGSCGGQTVLEKGGWKRTCTSCGLEQFPRTDPVVIAAVVSPDGERVLVGRQASWPRKFFSCLAGFVDPGESLEEAVRREVMEEAGVAVSGVCYHSSQPWPNAPGGGQVMLGFLAVAESEGLAVDTAELESARWASREELCAALAVVEEATRGADGRIDKDKARELALLVPPPMAIAHHLLTAAVAVLDHVKVS